MILASVKGGIVEVGNGSDCDLIAQTRQGSAFWMGGFFPYYAGYPARFAIDVIRSAGLVPRSSVLDPWNGSGTTTYAAAQPGHTAIGFDVNPVMIVSPRSNAGS